jgi:hypothetical protein
MLAELMKVALPMSNRSRFKRMLGCTFTQGATPQPSGQRKRPPLCRAH